MPFLVCVLGSGPRHRCACFNMVWNLDLPVVVSLTKWELILWIFIFQEQSIKSQITSTKFQINFKSQYSMTKALTAVAQYRLAKLAVPVNVSFVKKVA